MKLKLKNTFLIAFCFFSKVISAQDLFFDKLENSVWMSDMCGDLNVLTNVGQIKLKRLNRAKTNLKQNTCLWTFSGRDLTLSYYKAKTGTDSLIGIFTFIGSKKIRTLNIFLNDNSRLIKYILSSESNDKEAVLNRRTYK